MISGSRPASSQPPALCITMGTAKTHVARLLTKLDARDRVQLVINAYEAGLVPASR
jgi:DNA-binding NarL/FixJ family response regulator